MPSWPTQGDYKDALQNPDTVFRDPDLRASVAERSPMGVPRARSGAFASVYKMTRGPKAVALKVFNFPNEDRANRYLAVSDYLKGLGAKKPTAMVGFEYHPEGIRVGKAWYPTLTMEWVKGKSLGGWVQETMEKKDLDGMRKMSELWVQLVLDLQAAKIAHGDLQHDNVMVVGTTPVLVDYDGLCVPALADPKNPLDQLEFGKPAYQHPARPAEKLGPHLDNFAAWIILIAMRACAADPGLYTRFVTKVENENLLFTPPDLANPEASVLWPELLKCKDAEVRDWAKMAREALDKPFDQIPPFCLDPFASLRKMVTARDRPAIAAEVARLTKAGKAIPPDLASAIDPLKELENLCKAAKPDYPAIAAEAKSLGGSGTAVPDRLKNLVADAEKRVACRDAVQKALGAKDARAVKAAYQKVLLDGWADKRLIVEAESAIAQVDVLDKFRKTFATPGDGRALVKLWDDEGFRVTGLPEADGYQAEANKWRTRITAAEDFVKLFLGGKATEQQLADAWGRVDDAGPHPTLIKPDHKARGELAERRAPALAKLAGVPAANAHKNDTALIAAWGDGTALAGCKEADAYVPRLNAARDRLNKVAAVKRAIDAADAGTGSEQAIADAGKPLKGYDHPHADRVRVAEASVAGLAALSRAVNEPNPSDLTIAAAMDDLRAANRDLLARLDKIDAKLAAEAMAAGRRRKILAEFSEIDKTHGEPDEQDRRWLALWDKHKAMMVGRRDSERLDKRRTIAENRIKASEFIVKAVDAREMFKLRELWDKYGARLGNYGPISERRAELDDLLAKADRVIGFQKKLESADTPFTEGDLQFLRENHAAFRPADKESIVRKVTAKLKTDAKLSPGRPPVKVIPVGRSATVTAQWGWAGHGLVSHCLVAVDKARHLNSPTEADQYGLLKCQFRDYTGEGGGKRLAPPPNASKVFVTVWAVVELGWTTVYGPPLHLGPASVAGY